MARIACLLGDGFEDVEFRVPYDKLRREGLEVDVIGKKAGQELVGYRGDERIKVEKSIDEVRPEDYDALFIPGGFSPDHLRADPQFVNFVREFDGLKRPLAAVCHGPQLLMTARLVKGRTLTAWKTIRDDLELAGARVKDEPVVFDGNWITSRMPEDLGPFSDALIGAVRQHAQRAAESAAQPTM
jgi:protease I